MTKVLEHALGQVDWEKQPSLEGLIASDEEARVKASEFTP